MPKVKQAPPQDQEEAELAFLGRELLAWLLWRADTGDASFGANGPTIAFGARARVKGYAGDGTDVALKGGQAAHAVAVRAALGCGRTLREAELTLFAGDKEWRFTLDADTLDLRSVRLPEAPREKRKKDDQADLKDEVLLSRLELLQELEDHIQAIYKEFMRERARPAWSSKTVPTFRDWLADGLRVDRA